MRRAAILALVLLFSVCACSSSTAEQVEGPLESADLRIHIAISMIWLAI